MRRTGKYDNLEDIDKILWLDTSSFCSILDGYITKVYLMPLLNSPPINPFGSVLAGFSDHTFKYEVTYLPNYLYVERLRSINAS